MVSFWLHRLTLTPLPGTLLAAVPGGGSSGLSPRVRGNHRLPYGGRIGGGSIPARAGEPWALFAAPLTKQVYPRACGGTDRQDAEEHSARGLSPRVRGNLSTASPATMRLRSIPAAWRGNHTHIDHSGIGGGSIPARAGGTFHRRQCFLAIHGLSPRVRGNPLRRPMLPSS